MTKTDNNVLQLWFVNDFVKCFVCFVQNLLISWPWPGTVQINNFIGVGHVQKFLITEGGTIQKNDFNGVGREILCCIYHELGIWNTFFSLV
jgi:hypothetical protein